MTWVDAVGGLAIILVSLAITVAVMRTMTDPGLKRSRSIERLAGRLGWSFTPDDVFDYAELPFTILDAESGRAANVVVGEAAGRPTCAFDHRRIRPDAPPELTSCVLVDLGVDCPRVVVRPVGQRHPLVETSLPIVGLDVPFTVWAADEQFARALLGPDLVSWLADQWPEAEFEVSGSMLLAWSPQRPPRRLGDLIRAVDALITRVPAGAWVYVADRP